MLRYAKCLGAKIMVSLVLLKGVYVHILFLCTLLTLHIGSRWWCAYKGRYHDHLLNSDILPREAHSKRLAMHHAIYERLANKMIVTIRLRSQHKGQPTSIKYPDLIASPQ